MKLISEVLEEAAGLCERGWTRRWFARDKYGSPCPVGSQYAASWCAVGAVQRTSQTEWIKPLLFLARSLGFTGTVEVQDWNDRDSRTQSEVVTALRTAAAQARKEGK